MTCGIYEIVNTANGKRYVGSSVNIEKRFATHLRELRKGTHHAGHLQNSYNKYGRDSYIINVLLECDPEELIAEEQKELDKGFDYNSSPTAGNTLGFRLSKEKRELRSRERKKRFQEDEEFRNHILNMAKGVPKTDQWRAKMSDLQSSRVRTEGEIMNMRIGRAELEKDKVLEVRRKRREGLSLKDISNSTGVSWIQCQRICSGERYTWAYDDEGPVFTEAEIKELKSKSKPINKTLFNFHHKEHGDRICTQWELKSEFPELSSSKVSSICSGGRNIHKGWAVKKAPY